jgi:Arc/MetJ-type ribon-helix-helix transcriptional regulator
MPNVEKISVALPSEKVEEMEVEELRRLWNEGIESGPSITADAVFARLKAKYAAMQKQDDA